MPASSMRCGENPPRPAAIRMISSVAAAPRLPAGSSQPKAFPGTKNSITTTPNAAPELMPSTSGLAIGLPVKRWIMQPATASITPANSAARMRGQRQGISSSSSVPLAQCQPCASRPKASAATMASSRIASPPSTNHSTCCRSASTLSPPFITGALMLRRRGSSHSSSGAPIRAVTEPVETSIHTRASQRIT